jgi:flagellar secretion chaperone FliS
MAPRATFANQYLKTKIETATPMELIVIMYDGAIKFLKEGLNNFHLHKRASYDENLTKAKRMIKELQFSLDLSVQPVSGQLFSLYDYMMREISDAICNRRECREKVERVLSMMKDLRDTWEKIKVKAPVEKEKMQLESLSITG